MQNSSTFFHSVEEPFDSIFFLLGQVGNGDRPEFRPHDLVQQHAVGELAEAADAVESGVGAEQDGGRGVLADAGQSAADPGRQDGSEIAWRASQLLGVALGGELLAEAVARAFRRIEYPSG